MEKRILPYTILEDKKSIEPKTRRWAGMQYENNATEVVFDLSALNIENALYRIDFNSAGAGYQPSENLTIEGGKISRSIPKYVTQYGGEVQITAEITVLDANNEAVSFLSYPVLVYLTDVERDAEGSTEAEINISEAEQSAIDAADRAEKSAQIAKNSETLSVEAQEKTEAARRALEGGAQFVFSGGDASGKGNINFVVDTQLSSASNNPIANKAVNKAVDELLTGLESCNARMDYKYSVLSQTKEANDLKVTSVNENSTDEQYPSAKCLYDNLMSVEGSINLTNDRVAKLETQKLLWNGASVGAAGGWYMGETQTITLPEKISEQPNGIVLVFQSFDGTTAFNSHYNTFFIPKQSVIDNNGAGRSFLCTTTRFSVMTTKYIYIHDDKLVGYGENTEQGTGESGIKYNNKSFVLTKVYGV